MKQEEEMYFSLFVDLNRRVLLVLCILVFFCSCDGQITARKSDIAKRVPTDGSSLQPQDQSVAARLTALFVQSDCPGFFRQFPGTFSEFNELYGFDDEKGAGPLYDQGESQIRFFFDCSGVSQPERIEKSIGIAIDGKWDADAVSTFQHAVVDLIFANPDEFKVQLSKLTESRASAFWFFILDTPEIQDPEVLRKYQRIRTLFADEPKMVRMIDTERARIVARGH